MKDRVFVITPGQVVVRDLRTQMVDVMETDISTEPLKDDGQFIEGTAL